MWVTALLLLSVLFPKPHVAAFSSNQSPVIRISPSGGTAFDRSGNLWVADLQNSRVLGFMAPFSSNMTPSIVLGQQGLSNRWGSGWYANQMTYPSQVAFDQHGNLWVADTYNSRVIEFIPPFHNGMNASLVIGQKAIFPASTPKPDWSSTVPRTSRNGLSSPQGIVFDASGDLWVADSWNGRVLAFQPPFSDNMNASLVIGERDFTSSCDDLTRPLCGDRHTLMMPTVAGFDAAGNLWVTDTINVGTYAASQWQGRLLEFNPPFKNGMNASLVVKEPGFSSFAFDPSGNLWVGSSGITGGAISGNVSEYSPPLTTSMKPSLVMQGIYTQGDPNSFGLAFDSSGNLWVAANYLLAFDAQVHSVLGPTGRVHFENDLGLLAPLSSIPITSIGFMSFPEGLFKLTTQGLPAGGSVKLTIAFPDTLPSGVGWANAMNSNPLAGGIQELQMLPASQVQVSGNSTTVTLTNASQEGVISVVGGPALSSITSSLSSTNSTIPPQSASRGSLTTMPVGVLIVAIIIIIAVFVAARKRTERALGREEAGERRD